MEWYWWITLICGSCCFGSLVLLLVISLIGLAIGRLSKKKGRSKGKASYDGSDPGEVIDGEYKDIGPEKVVEE